MILKWHGGKHYLAPYIVKLLPYHNNYVEPFFGGGAVLFQKPVTGSEVVNDIDSDLVNFWLVVRDKYDDFLRQVTLTPYSEELWRRAIEGDDVQRAVQFFVRVRQSMSGRMDCFSPVSKTRLRREINEQVAGWMSAIDKLPEVVERLRTVMILNRDALSVIRQLDAVDTCFYLDPPYVPETRTAPQVYKHELPDHRPLIELLRTIKGRAILSGYQCELYSTLGWRRVDIDIANHAGSGRRTESLWLK